MIDAVNAGPDTDDHNGTVPTPPPSHADLIGYIWFDDNADGIWDPNEKGVPGVVVKLLDAHGQTIREVQTSNRFTQAPTNKRLLQKQTQTDPAGIYRFDGLVSNRTYRVKVDTATLPEGYVLTLKGEGDAAHGSAVDPTTGLSDPITPDPGTNTLRINIGIHYDGATPETPYLIGRYFWIDKDGDSRYDGGDKGVDEPIAGAKVELFDDRGNKLYWSDPDKHTLTTTPTEYPAEVTTSPKGEYAFRVPAGTYQIRFHIPPSLLKKGYSYGDGVDKDGFTQKVTMGAGGAPQNFTLDAALGCPCSKITGNAIPALRWWGGLGMVLGMLGIALIGMRRRIHA